MLVLHAAGPAPACRPTMKPSSRTYRLLSVLLSLSLIGATVVAAAPHLRCAAASGHVAACVQPAWRYDDVGLNCLCRRIDGGIP